jgi:putative membrane protein
MWNFAGRQNDLQGNGEPEHGNWITGISFIDNALYGNQDMMPDELKANKGHNVFYCLPLLLGLIGLFWQAWRGKRGIQQFWVVFFLFFMTGLAIVVYLNQTPSQPRERDYAYAGSFYAYAIWCGLGVLALYDWARKLKLAPVLSASVVSLACLFVPIQMASQTWDDHDRSGRYTCRDFGQNYLMSLQQKGYPIIFTNGDNDTFPLWYDQEVEGIRTDSRVCNLSYLQTDWYIDQMKRPAYTSPSVPISWPRLDYVSGTNEYVPVQPEFKQQIKDFYKQNPAAAKAQFGDDPFELKNILKYWVRSKDPQTHVIPTDTIYMKIDKEAVRKSGMMLPGDSIPDRMVISLQGKQALYKGDLMMLEMIANCNWTRPLYVAITVGSENFMNLGDNFVQEGLANRITPFNTQGNSDQTGINMRDFDTEKTYDVMMNRFKWGGLNVPGLYIDETVMRMCYTHRREMANLALHLIAKGEKEKALKVLQKLEKVLPTYNVPVSYMSGSGDMAQAYAMLGQKAKARQLYDALWKISMQYANYYMSLPPRYFDMSQSSCKMHFQIMMNLVNANDRTDRVWANKHAMQLNNMMIRFKNLGGSLEQV